MGDVSADGFKQLLAAEEKAKEIVAQARKGSRSRLRRWIQNVLKCGETGLQTQTRTLQIAHLASRACMLKTRLILCRVLAERQALMKKADDEAAAEIADYKKDRQKQFDEKVSHVSTRTVVVRYSCFQTEHTGKRRPQSRYLCLTFASSLCARVEYRFIRSTS
jgi:hypothetical protein